MTEDTQSLDEVVVVGYGTQKKLNVTGAVAVSYTHLFQKGYFSFKQTSSSVE